MHASSGHLQVAEVLIKILKGDVFYGNTFSSFFSPVVGYTNDTESLQIDEGSDTTLIVRFLKPPVGTFTRHIIIAPFLINNAQNTGSL